MFQNVFFDDCIAIACVTLVSIFGLISNSTSFYITLTSSHFRNAFGILCSGFLICNLQDIFVHFTWCTIVLSIKSPILSSSQLFFVRLVGLILNAGWFGSLLIHFFTALNRFSAFVFATKYNQLWSQSNAFKIVIIAWTSSMVYCSHHLYENCSLLFHAAPIYRWLHHNSFHGKICASIDATASIGIVIAMACIDFITFIKMFAYRKAMRSNITRTTGNIISEREIMFFKQSCKLGLLYISCVLAFNITPYFFTNKWVLFTAGTIAWILVKLTFLIFNRKLIYETNFRTVTIVPATNMNMMSRE
uniref:7TM_GPCR_Srx domain-containing protein n=1 Tax=Onchocerca volvulus TaxID=6282 RepID=A0A8R1TM79_ONCVO